VTVFSAVARFRDTSGLRWLVRSDGYLSEETATRQTGADTR
jgi:hypothetical protein